MSDGRANSPTDLAPPWVLVASGFHPHGGMEKANAALARFLLSQGHPLHLVAFSVEEELERMPGVTVHRVRAPFNSFLLGQPLLNRAGRRIAGRVTGDDRRARVLVNGGNCEWSDLNWVHCVHHAWPCVDQGAPVWFRVKSRIAKMLARRDERKVIPSAQLVLANSNRTRSDLAKLVKVDPARIRTVYLGADEGLEPAESTDREAARLRLGLPPDRPLVAFVGALGYDRNKGLDVLLSAWKKLCADASWDVHLVAAGGGLGLDRWKSQVKEMGLEDRVRFLGFTREVPRLLEAADLLVSPARYDAYGLNVQEAICRGIPALVSATAGISERYPEALEAMVLQDPEDADELRSRLLAWRASMPYWREQFRDLRRTLLRHGWEEMARSIVSHAGDERRAGTAAGVGSGDRMAHAQSGQ